MYCLDQFSHGEDFDRQLGSKKQWKRILYENQLFPDNFIDSQRFLDQLDVSTNNPHMTDLSVLYSASVIAQQLSVVAVFFATYKYIIVHDTALYHLVLFDFTMLVVGHVFNRALETNALAQPTITQFFRGVFLFGVCLRVAAPALQTLTSSFSGNTIHALAIAFSSVHLVFYDYSYIHDSEVDVFSGTLSLNASMFTAVLLASRLKNIEMVFSFMLLAVICFSFYPSVARLMYQRSLALHLAVTLFQWGLASSLLFFLDFALFTFFQFLIIFVWIVCPLWLQQMQRYKKTFRGPWDIAEG